MIDRPLSIQDAEALLNILGREPSEILIQQMTDDHALPALLAAIRQRVQVLAEHEEAAEIQSETPQETHGDTGLGSTSTLSDSETAVDVEKCPLLCTEEPKQRPDGISVTDGIEADTQGMTDETHTTRESDREVTHSVVNADAGEEKTDPGQPMTSYTTVSEVEGNLETAADTDDIVTEAETKAETTPDPELASDAESTPEIEGSEAGSNVTPIKESKQAYANPQPRTLKISIPNGMANREYSHALTESNFKARDYHLPAELALEFNEETQQISGMPNKAGEYQLRFEGEYLTPGRTPQPAFLLARLTVNPDPRSLWADIPSDPASRFHKPDTDSMSEDVNGLRLLAASRRGRSHAHKGTHRDDEARIAALPQSHWNILAVADGAGSCQFSRRGSQLAIQTAVDFLTEQLEGEWGEKLTQACLAQKDLNSNFNAATTEALRSTMISAGWNAALSLRQEAEDEHISLKDLSTTLLLLIHKETPQGHLAVSFSVGDGAIAAFDKERGVHLLCTPDSGEYAGQTRFLEAGLFKDADIYQRVKVALLPQMTSLLALSDGITDPLFETEANLAKDEPWRSLWGDMETLLKGTAEQAEASVLEWMNFLIPGYHDDRSVALLAIRGEHD